MTGDVAGARCVQHADAEAVATCRRCGDFRCRACLGPSEPVCAACRARAVATIPWERDGLGGLADWGRTFIGLLTNPMALLSARTRRSAFGGLSFLAVSALPSWLLATVSSLAWGSRTWGNAAVFGTDQPGLAELLLTAVGIVFLGALGTVVHLLVAVAVGAIHAVTLRVLGGPWMPGAIVSASAYLLALSPLLLVLPVADKWVSSIPMRVVVNVGWLLAGLAAAGLAFCLVRVSRERGGLSLLGRWLSVGPAVVLFFLAAALWSGALMTELREAGLVPAFTPGDSPW